MVVVLDRPDDAELVFTSAAMNVRARLDSVDAAGRRFDAASPERCIEIRRLPAAMPAASFSARFTDASAARGEHAYWVRVRQTDGAYAWSTPIFVTLRGD